MFETLGQICLPKVCQSVCVFVWENDNVERNKLEL